MCFRGLRIRLGSGIHGRYRAVGTGPAGPVLAGPLFGRGLVPRRTDVWERDYFGRAHVREHEAGPARIIILQCTSDSLGA